MRSATTPVLPAPAASPSRAPQRPARPIAASEAASPQQKVDVLAKELDTARGGIEALHAQLEEARRDLAVSQRTQVATQAEREHARKEVETTRQHLEAVRAQLEQAQADVHLLRERLAHTSAEVGELADTLGRIAARLRRVAKTTPYRIAHLFRRVALDMLKGDRRDRNAALRWLRRRLVGRQTSRELAKNPLLDEAALLWRGQETLAVVAEQLRQISTDAEPAQRSVPSLESKAPELWHAAPSAVGGTRARSRRRLGRLRLNPYEFLFDTYRRSRDRMFPINWQRVGVPYQPKLVSIVVPCFDSADFIRQALDSILSQTYTDLEVIALNDGSSDETGAILDAYARSDRRVTVLHQDNQQLPRTLSRGFRLARGEFLTWTSADNRLKPTCIAKMVDALERHPDWDMLYANYDMIGEGGEPLRGTTWLDAYQVPLGSEHICLPSDTAELNVWPNNYIGGAFLYRARVAWLLGDYSPARFLMEDYDYWMRVNELLTLRHADFDDYVYEYRVHNRSLTSKDRELGITRNRTKLMVFDDFRRSFHLSKTLWVVTSDDSAAASKLADALKTRVHQAQHVLGRMDDLAQMALPRLWMPTVWVHVAAELDRLPRRLPVGQHAARVLVSTDGVLELPHDADWEMCITTRPAPGDGLPRLGNGYAGWWSVCNVGELFTLCDLRAKTCQLAAIELQANDRMNDGTAFAPRVSVIICTHPRSGSLQRTLRAVAGQTLARSEYEVVIVNTAPCEPSARDAIATIREECFASAPDRIRLVDCPLPGLSHAQNAGISEARGEYVVFLDHDAVPDPECLEWFLRGFEAHPNAGVIGGHVRLKLPTPRPPACPAGREALWNQFLTRHTAYVEATQWWEYPHPENWAARRAVLVQMGGIRSNWGHIGADCDVGREVAVASLTRQLGYAVGIEPRAQAHHDVQVERYTEAHAVNAIHAGITAYYRLQQNLYLPRRSVSGLWRDLKRALRTAVVGRNDGRRHGGVAASCVDKRYDREVLRARFRVLRMAVVDLLQRSRRTVTSG